MLSVQILLDINDKLVFFTVTVVIEIRFVVVDVNSSGRNYLGQGFYFCELISHQITNLITGQSFF